MSMQSIVWLALLVAFLIIELATMGLTTIWFAGGALTAFLFSMSGMSVPVQIIAFLVVSLVLLVLTRPVAMKYVNRNRIKTNAESLIGTVAVVTEDIDDLSSKGQVMADGQEWSARTSGTEGHIKKGVRVKVLEIRGVKLIVEEEK